MTKAFINMLVVTKLAAVANLKEIVAYIIQMIAMASIAMATINLGASLLTIMILSFLVGAFVRITYLTSINL